MIETDEERIEGLSFPAYRRIATVIELRSRPGRPGVTEVATIDPPELEMALERDVISRARLTPEPSLGELFEDEVLQQAVRSARLTMGEFKETLLAPAARIRRPQSL